MQVRLETAPAVAACAYWLTRVDRVTERDVDAVSNRHRPVVAVVAADRALQTLPARRQLVIVPVGEYQREIVVEQIGDTALPFERTGEKWQRGVGRPAISMVAIAAYSA